MGEPAHRAESREDIERRVELLNSILVELYEMGRDCDCEACRRLRRFMTSVINKIRDREEALDAMRRLEE